VVYTTWSVPADLVVTSTVTGSGLVLVAYESESYAQNKIIDESVIHSGC